MACICGLYHTYLEQWCSRGTRPLGWILRIGSKISGTGLWSDKIKSIMTLFLLVKGIHIVQEKHWWIRYLIITYRHLKESTYRRQSWLPTANLDLQWNCLPKNDGDVWIMGGRGKEPAFNHQRQIKHSHHNEKQSQNIIRGDLWCWLVGHNILKTEIVQQFTKILLDLSKWKGSRSKEQKYYLNHMRESCSFINSKICQFIVPKPLE